MSNPVRLLPNHYGHFDPDTSEFVIADVLTPRPWVNVLANEQYGAVVSQVGGGFSWFGNCQLFRLSRWDQDLSTDAMGRFVYVQDADKPKAIFSTTWQPTKLSLPGDRVRHGLGYTVYEREFVGLATSQTVFVPLDSACEVWLIEVQNRGASPRRVRLTTYVEWHLGGVGDWHREFHRLFIETRVRGNALIARRHPGLHPHSRNVVDGSVGAVSAITGVGDVEWLTDKRTFLGRRGDMARPEALCGPSLHPGPQGRGDGCTGRWDDPVGCGSVLFELSPGESKRVVVILGAGSSDESNLAMAQRFDADAAEDALAEVKAHWRSLCSDVSVQSPEPALDVLCNAWLPYQAVAGRMLARCGYYQQSGAYGYRDQLQDSLIHLLSQPSRCFEQIRLHAEAMYEDGGVRHWWHPGTDIYTESRHSDTALWLPFAVLAYLDETGDAEALDEDLGFLSRNSYGCSGSLLEHSTRALDRSLDRLSPRGLPLIEAGDWNDGLSHAGIEGRGESVWLGMFLYTILERWNGYLKQLGRSQAAERYAGCAESLRRAVNEWGWDEDRYVAGYRDDGKPFGARECTEGSLYLNPQTWAVISGIAPPERAQRAMRTAREQLLKPYGALLLRPAYTALDPYIGYITRYAPGLRENGGVYCHAAMWAVQAFSMMGDADTALAVFRSLCPPLRSSENPDRYAAEPYVMPGNVDGPDSPHEGRAGWTWYTGSAAWMKRVAFDWLCGVRAEPEGLRVRPILPSGWDRFRIRRPFRGDVFEIEVRKPKGYGGPADGPIADVLLYSSGSGKTQHVGLP
ncbi:MAG: glycosyl transferase family 36 [Fimbriimonadia bacterium]